MAVGVGSVSVGVEDSVWLAILEKAIACDLCKEPELHPSIAGRQNYGNRNRAAIRNHAEPNHRLSFLHREGICSIVCERS